MALSAEPIVRISWFSLLNLYLLRVPTGYILVDTGMPGMFSLISNKLGALGIKPGDLKGVVLTHTHIDHLGTAAQFAKIGVPIFALADDCPYIDRLGPTHSYGGLGGTILQTFERFIPKIYLGFEVVPLRPETYLLESPWRILAAPGHTPGSLALWHEREGMLLSGDTLVTTFGWPRGPVPLFTADLETARSSALKLLSLAPGTIWPGHGPPVSCTRFERLKTRLELQRHMPCGVHARCNAHGSHQ